MDLKESFLMLLFVIHLMGSVLKVVEQERILERNYKKKKIRFMRRKNKGLKYWRRE
jgi:hypothetical protein